MGHSWDKVKSEWKLHVQPDPTQPNTNPGSSTHTNPTNTGFTRCAVGSECATTISGSTTVTELTTTQPDARSIPSSTGPARDGTNTDSHNNLLRLVRGTQVNSVECNNKHKVDIPYNKVVHDVDIAIIVDETLAMETVPQTQKFIKNTTDLDQESTTNTGPLTTTTTTPKEAKPGVPTEHIPTNLLVGRVSYSPTNRLVGHVQSC